MLPAPRVASRVNIPRHTSVAACWSRTGTGVAALRTTRANQISTLHCIVIGLTRERFVAFGLPS